MAIAVRGEKPKDFATKHIDLVKYYKECKPKHSEIGELTLLDRLAFIETYPSDDLSFASDTYFGEVILSSTLRETGQCGQASLARLVGQRFVKGNFSLLHPAVSFFGFPSTKDKYQPDNIDEITRKPTIRERIKAFVGWPQPKVKNVVFYALTGGPFTRIPFNIARMAVTTLISIAKIFTELLPRLVQNRAIYLFKMSAHAFKQSKNPVIKGLALFGMLCSAIAYYAAKYIKIIARTATSPIKSFKIGWNKHPALGIASGLLTLGFAFITIPFAIKAAIVLGGPKVAAALTVAGEKLMASSAFAQIGTFLSTILPGAISAELATLTAAISLTVPPLLLGLKELCAKVSFKLAIYDSKTPTDTGTADLGWYGVSSATVAPYSRPSSRPQTWSSLKGSLSNAMLSLGGAMERLTTTTPANTEEEEQYRYHDDSSPTGYTTTPPIRTLAPARGETGIGPQFVHVSRAGAGH